MSALLVFVGGCVGALARYLTDRAVSSRRGIGLPWGTFVVNMAGSAVLGVITGGVTGSDHWVVLLLGTGLCGALTTFSTFSLETIRLLEDGSVLMAAANVVGSVAVGLLCVTAGFQLGTCL